MQLRDDGEKDVIVFVPGLVRVLAKLKHSELESSEASTNMGK